ncbi:MAG: uracil-DNA glycosylase [Gammaproteobacteria bacterium]|nr:uracil-DNA glycosylase [Gammaproteobacteria bacterium]MCY4312799.1 uracil-DNA glycosylase [Gammaproteobacteria bacterium]
MTPAQYVNALSKLNFANAFNPYSNRCAIYDLDKAPLTRSQTLQDMLEAATEREIDSIWIGRDLGYRGGRRTGLALTDDVHIQVHGERWRLSIDRPTKGEIVAEQTAAVVWRVLSQVKVSIFLWNVFPLHPYEPGSPFSNRSHNARERRAGEEFLSELIMLLKPSRLVAIGNDAARTAYRLRSRHEVIKVRHPSYGGQIQFSAQVSELYKLDGDGKLGIRT